METSKHMIKQAINVRYIYSACIITSTPDIKVLHDPWFTEGIYDGSWFHFPQVVNPLESIGDVDMIYISHIHPDHYDKEFLKKYFECYGYKTIIIADHTPNHLAGKMKADGLMPTILKHKLVVGNTSLEIIPHNTGSISDIDSAIIIKYLSEENKIHCVVNANDIIFDESMINNLKSTAGEVDILLCSYTGAGPYPQTYFDISSKQIIIESEKKKFKSFERYKSLVKMINAKINIPFAGKYMLGGRLVWLNQFRGIADAVEVLEFDKNAIVLADNGAGEIDTESLTPRGIRINKYNEVDELSRMNELRSIKMDYERLINIEEIKQIPFKRLLKAAVQKALKNSECKEDYYFSIELPDNELAVINANKNSKSSIYFVHKLEDLPLPRSEITIDPRYLFGLLTGVYHWNNAEVGSQYQTRRFPNILNRKAQLFLNFLTI